MVREILCGASEPPGAFGHELVAVLQEVTEKRREIVDLDIAADIGVGEPDRAPPKGFGNGREVVDDHARMLAGARPAKGLRFPIGEGDGHGAATGPTDQALAEPGGDGRYQIAPQRRTRK